MAWTKGKVEKAWRIFMKASDVIAEALDVPGDELRALLLEGVIPKIEAPTPEHIEQMADEIALPPDEEPTKRATLADLAPAPPSQILEQAAPIIDKPLEFRPEPKRPPYVAPVSKPAPNAVPAVDQMIADRGPAPSRSRAHPYIPPAKPKALPATVYLMHEGKYLHESCTGLTDKKAHAWRQPPGKVAAVRRKFPETVDYTEVPAS